MPDIDKKIEDFEALAARLQEEQKDAVAAYVEARAKRDAATEALTGVSIKIKLLEAERDGIKPGDAVWVAGKKLAFMGFRHAGMGKVEPYFHKLKKDGKAGRQFVYVSTFAGKMQKVED